MCDPVTIAVVASLAATGVSAYNTHRTAKKQDQALAAGMRRQGERQRELNQRLNETLLFFEDSAPDEYREKLSQQFRQQLRLKQGQALAGLEREGDISNEAVSAAHKAGATAIDYGDFLEGVFSRIDAPADQRRFEGYERQDLQSESNRARRDIGAEDFLTRLDVQSITRNPWLDLLAAGIQGAGQGYAASGSYVPMFAGGGGQPATVPGSVLPPSSFYNASSGMYSPASLYGIPGP